MTAVDTYRDLTSTAALCISFEQLMGSVERLGDVFCCNDAFERRRDLAGVAVGSEYSWLDAILLKCSHVRLEAIAFIVGISDQGLSLIHI